MNVLKFGEDSDIRRAAAARNVRDPHTKMHVLYGTQHPPRTCGECRFLLPRETYGLTTQSCLQFQLYGSFDAKWKAIWPACGKFEPARSEKSR